MSCVAWTLKKRPCRGISGRNGLCYIHNKFDPEQYIHDPIHYNALLIILYPTILHDDVIGVIYKWYLQRWKNKAYQIMSKYLYIRKMAPNLGRIWKHNFFIHQLKFIHKYRYILWKECTDFMIALFGRYSFRPSKLLTNGEYIKFLACDIMAIPKKEIIEKINKSMNQSIYRNNFRYWEPYLV